MSSIITPEEFFNLVSGFSNQDSVIRACIDLLESLEHDLWVKTNNGDKAYETSTISKMLTAYRSYFYDFVSPMDSLNEVVEIRHYHPDGEFVHTFKRKSDKHGVKKAGETRNYSIIQKKQHRAANLLALSQSQLLELVDRQIDNWIEAEEAEAEAVV